MYEDFKLTPSVDSHNEDEYKVTGFFRGTSSVEIILTFILTEGPSPPLRLKPLVIIFKKCRCN